MMMDRREFLLGSIGAGIAAARGGGFATAQETESIRAMLKQPVGANAKVVGMVAVTVDERSIRKATFGSSGVPGLTLGSDTVLLQLRVLRLRGHEDGNVKVGVFPKSEEVLEGFPRFHRVTRDLGTARQT